MLAGITVLLASCGGSGLPSNSTTAGTGPTSTSSNVSGAPSIAIALTDPTTGSPTTSTPATVKATVLNAAGAPVPNVVVTFSADAAVATLSPSTGTALTNASGIATISLNAATSTAGGASTVTANGTVQGTPVSTSIGFAVNASAPAAGVSFTSLTFGTNTLSAYGTTGMTATVTPATTPVTVTFTSTCAGTGKATLSSSVKTVGGIAMGSYLDNGCASTDTVTASVAGTTATTSATLVVTPPATGSLQYVSASPTTISLQGTGGTSSSTVTFKVVDSGGNPIGGKIVTFGLSTTLGGITFTPNVAAPTATSDALGLVSVIVNAGTMSTPVRVTASTPGATAGSVLTTQSSQLTITTGIPDQDSFSLAATTINTEGWNIDGLTSTLTARLSDHFNNPVPDGTAVNFTTEGGSVIGSCTTVNGACTSTFTTQQPRPSNGRVSVLAFAIGEESFTDLNGNGVADLVTAFTSAANPSGNEMRDANGLSTDMPEAFVDYNENGAFDAATEPYQDFNGSGAYDAADGQYNGVLCNALSSAGTCSATKSAHVRRMLVLTMSSSKPDTLALFDNGAPPAAATSINLPACDNMVGGVTTMDATTYYVRVVDVNGNAMPTGTTISFATSNGTLLSTASFTTLNDSGCSTAYAGCPSSAGTALFGYYPVTLQSDATYTAPVAPAVIGTCTNTKTSGVLTVTVRTPGGAGMGSTTTTTTFTVKD